MQHVLGMILRGNDAEIIDDDSLSGPKPVIMDLFSGMNEGHRRMIQNPDIVKINIYEVFDGVRRISATGKYQLVHQLIRETP